MAHAAPATQFKESFDGIGHMLIVPYYTAQAGNATLLYYMSDEAKEFHRAQQEKRKPDARKYPWLP